MSFKILLIFVNVYREESITATAKKLGISQPAVSAAIKELENHFGMQLFVRIGRGIRRTPNAEHLYEYASHIVSLYQEMNRSFADGTKNIPLRIGSSISIGTCLLPTCIRMYVKDLGMPMPYIKIDSSDIIEQMVLDNQLDFAFIEGAIHSDRILSEALLKDRLILVCGREHPLARKQTITLDDIREECFLLREKNSGTRELAESALLLHDFTLKPAWESTSTTAIIQAVIQNLGISILPARMLTSYLEEGTLVELHLSGILFLREYNLIYHQNKYLNEELTQALDFFKNTIRAQ